MAFVILIAMILNYALNSILGFNQDTFMLITFVVIIVTVFLFFLLSRPLLEPLFESDQNLKKALKETIHELNIPVSTIDMNVKMLQKKIDDEKMLKRLGRIEKANDSLLKLYADMEYSIKKEIEHIEDEIFYLDEVIQNSIEKVEDIKGDIIIESKLPHLELNSDQRGFEKMIDNLLSNALKYNKEHGVVQIEFSDSILSIYNSGVSIDTKNLFYIFDEYFQENPEVSGFGLGLKMVKEFCDKHALKIKIEPLEEGTRVAINLEAICI